MELCKPQAWYDKNERINAHHLLCIGDRVKDENGNTGVVVKIIYGKDIEDHGTIFVWQEDRYEYGADNCEHYSQINWHKYLRVLE